MEILHPGLRGFLEKTIVTARDVAENAAKVSLATLGVQQPEPPRGLSEERRILRRQLRQRARLLSDPLEKSQDAPFSALANGCAYGQWHRMLFARFLAENGLLIHPTGVAVTLAECSELAAEEGEPDGWMVAARYAAEMLPGIFRNEDPVMQVRFAPEGRQSLEKLLSTLPSEVFLADDSLGWVYQFWQTKRKAEVNRSGRKISGTDIPPVTQLFTEHYMVEFLLHNTLGAWWIDRHPEARHLFNFRYLRLKEDGTPAAGAFRGWPNSAKELRLLDPCCGSGHFLVATFEFEMLRQMRMYEEGLNPADAGDAVLRDNLFGLEIDPRCIQIGAFALALTAWKTGGYRSLPIPNLACSGLSVGDRLYEWTQLANGDQELEYVLRSLYHMFRDAPDLGSLLSPTIMTDTGGLFTPTWGEVSKLVDQALTKEKVQEDPVASVFGAAAKGLVRAADFLSRKYHLVATNVPYLARGKQGDVLRHYCDRWHKDAKADLATACLERSLSLAQSGGSIALVTPQNWFFLSSYKALRKRLLHEKTWVMVARLGPGAFETISGEVVNVALLIMTNAWPAPDHAFAALDASALHTSSEKAGVLRHGATRTILQVEQSGNPDVRVTLEKRQTGRILQEYARSYKGISSGDYPRFGRCFWELPRIRDDWRFQQSTVESTLTYGGLEHIFYWQEGTGEFFQFVCQRLGEASTSAWIRGREAWGNSGVVLSIMREMPASIYQGTLFDNNISVVVPYDREHLLALWAYCSSREFGSAVRRLNQKLSVTDDTLVKVPFDLAHWQKVAEEQYPNGLPEPYSNDPTQWLFEGHPTGSTDPLQVAVARLLGYRWPRQTGAEVSGCKPVPEDGLEAFADKDGIVCLPAVSGEQPAEERLRALLAFGPPDPPILGGAKSAAEPSTPGSNETFTGPSGVGQDTKGSTSVQDRLLAGAGFGGKSLGEWLRDGFFAQHCKLFHNRPFIWHIWDGRKDGFSALVNYHQLDRARLEKLVYTYLGAWINLQQEAESRNEPGANARLVAARDLKRKLEAILEGESPYDIYIRWKPLHEQPIGWNPDLNDGVRLNIRPIVTAGVLRSKFTINWNKDRGTNPDGSERLNDLHFTRAEKERARREKGGVEWRE